MYKKKLFRRRRGFFFLKKRGARRINESCWSWINLIIQRSTPLIDTRYHHHLLSDALLVNGHHDHDRHYP